MGITFGTVVTNIFINSILLVLIAGILKCNKIISDKTIKIIYICIIFNTLKLIFPVEFFFTKSIRLQRVLPHIFQVLHTPIIKDKYTLINFMILIWFSVALVKGGFLIRKNLHFHRLISSIPDISTQRIDKVFAQMNVERDKIKVKKLGIATPVIMGVFRPVILLPNVNYNDDELKYILTHEIYHYKHHDLWLKYLTEFVIIIYWWYPPVYLLRKQICMVTEINNDFAITINMDIRQQIDYLQCLIKVADKNNCKDGFSLAFAGNKRSDLEQRIKIVLYNGKNKFSNKAVVYFLLVITICTFFFNFEPEFPFPKDAFAITEETYLLYENDNYYIISDGENMGMIKNIENLNMNILTKEINNENN